MSRVLNNEREHLRSLFNQAPGFVAVLMGPKHVFELANEAYYQLVGHREIIGKTVWEALPEVAGQGFEEFLESVYKTGVPWSARGMSLMIQPEPDGPTIQRYVDLVYQPYRDAQGETIGIFAQGYDVTEAVEAQAAKRDSDERLKDGMAAAKMLVWDWNLATGALEFSDNVTLVLGFNPERMEVVSACIHPEDQEKIKKAHAQALAESGSYQEIVRFNRPDTGKPEMDCYELARRLRADPANQRALFIALTGYGQAHDKVLSRSVGFEHHFVKPMDTDRLRQLLNAVVR